MPSHSTKAGGVTRRTLLATAGAALATPMLARRSFAQATELTMLAWYGHAEPDMVAGFEAENNVRFVPKYYTGGDNMLGLISQSPPGTFDVILSDAEYVQQLNAAGYIEALDPADYPFDDFFPEFHKFPGHWDGDTLYSVITRFGFLGVAYNTEALTEAQSAGDVLGANAIVMDAFYTDVRPMLAERRVRRGLPADPMAAYAGSGHRERIVAERVGGTQSSWGA